MSQIIKLYKELFDTLYEQKAHYNEIDMCCFNHGKGKNYTGELMIVGRAVNGWNVTFNKEVDSRPNLIETITKTVSTDDLEWVKEQWQNGNGEYDTIKSAFWRVSKQLASRLTTGSEFETDSIIWNNLYKISKSLQGNPSYRLMNVQVDACKKILIEEISLHNPNIIIFLTGLDWAEPFLTDFESLPIIETNEYVQYIGRYADSYIIVGQHPQGKKESEHIDEIIRNYNFVSNSKK